MNWNYKLSYVDTKILKYIPTTFKILNYKPVKIFQYSPHQHILIKYGKGYPTNIHSNNTLINDKAKYI